MTQTVVIELDEKARPKKAEYHDGVIRSAARMAYQQVQKIVDGDPELRGRYAALVPLVDQGCLQEDVVHEGMVLVGEQRCSRPLDQSSTRLDPLGP